MRRSLLLLLAAAACAEGAAGRGSAGAGQVPIDSAAKGGEVARDSAAPGSAGATAAGGPAPLTGDPNAPNGPPRLSRGSGVPDTAVIRAIYINRFAVMGSRTLRHLIDIADSTEVNAFVIDVKDEWGLSYESSDPAVQRNGGSQRKVRNMKAVLDTLRAHNIYPIARLVVFKDSVAARVNPDHVIRKPDGSPWRDKQGLTWVSPYDEVIWEYNFRVAEEAVKMGFAEIQWDYIRFPEPYKSLPPQVFPNQKGRSKPQVLADFLKASNDRLDKLGVRVTADIFGLVTTVRGPLEIGQEWEKVAPVTDVVLPMVYPSHYPRNSLGVAHPNGQPYDIIFRAISRARERNEKLGIKGEHVRPWLQAFTLGKPDYGAEQLDAQKRAVYDAGYDGWVLWHPGSKYDHIRPALEGTAVTRRKTPPVVPPKFGE